MAGKEEFPEESISWSPLSVYWHWLLNTLCQTFAECELSSQNCLENVLVDVLSFWHAIWTGAFQDPVCEGADGSETREWRHHADGAADSDTDSDEMLRRDAPESSLHTVCGTAGWSSHLQCAFTRALSTHSCTCLCFAWRLCVCVWFSAERILASV